MSKYKIGDKAYLECEVTDVDIDVLHPTDDTYDKGLNDLWNLTKKIVLSEGDGGYSYEELENIFGYKNLESVLKAFTPQEALEKVKAYEEKCNKIKVGDVVRLEGCCVKGIVTRVTKTNIYRLFKDGSSTKEAFEDVEGFVKKTGEHFDSIDEFMRSADD